jgi:pimeloyl-ACP methyl ester carboxylesterase
MNLQSKTSAPGETSRQKGLSPIRVGLGLGAVALAATALFNTRRAKRVEHRNPPRGKFIKIDGVDVHYVDSGQGSAILLLHGNGVTIEDWFAAGVYQELAKKNRVIAFDRPGFGYTTRPRTRLWTPAAQAQLFATALRSLGVSDAVVVGHSYGTVVSLALGLDHPGMVRRLVLLGGYYFPSPRADVIIASPPAIPFVGDIIRYTGSPLLGAALRQRLEKKIFGPAPVPERWRERYPFEMTLRPSQIRAEAAEAALMIPAASEMSCRYSELTMPITLIAGAGDQIADPHKQTRRFAEALANAALVIVPEAGHMVHHTAPDSVVELIRGLNVGQDD